MIKTVYKIYKDILKSRLCSACLEASWGPRTSGVPINNKRGRGSMSCLLWGGLIVPSYSPDRLVSQSATKSCSRAKILFELGCDTLEQRRYKHRMITFFKMVKKKLTPPYLQDLVPPSVHQVSNRNLRNQFDLTIPRSRTNLYDSSFIPTATREWNSLPEEIKSSTSIAIFKRMLNRDKVKVPFFFYNGNRKAQIFACSYQTRM